MTVTKVELHEDGVRELLNSPGLRRHLDRLCFLITGHAIPHSGVDTGALTGSMSHQIEQEDGVLVGRMGSGAADGVAEVWYAAPHWADRKPTIAAPMQRGKRVKVPHPTTPAPSKPYSKAMRALGIRFTVEPGGFES